MFILRCSLFNAATRFGGVFDIVIDRLVTNAPLIDRWKSLFILENLVSLF